MTDLWSIALEHAAQEFEKPDYTLDPVRWGSEVLGEFYWSKQREIFDSIREHRYTAVQSCHDSGKSFIAARVAAWWLSVHPPGTAFIVTTAPTAAQVYAILWREITKAHTKGRLPGRIVTSGYPQWKLDSGELVGYGRKPADYEESAFQGIHAMYVLVIMDEAGGIEKNLYDAVDALATNEYARVLAIGNPDDPGSHFRRICRPKSGWNAIRIDGLRTPNMTRALIERTRCAECDSGKPELLIRLMEEEQIPYSTEELPEAVRPMLLSPLWVEERLHRWVGRPGRDKDGQPESLAAKAEVSALFTSKVRGLFPDTSSTGVIPLGWIERAVERWRDWNEAGRPNLGGRIILGVDVAREGDDETVLYQRRGVTPLDIQAFSGKDTQEVADLASGWLQTPGAIAVVDVIGIGAGVVDRLRRMPHEPGYNGAIFNTVAFNAAAREEITNHRDRTGQFRFRNVRSAAWWNMRELLDPTQAGGAVVMLPDDEDLIADLTAPRWQVYASGIIGIESKDDIKKRLGRSTDRGDACIQSHFYEIGPLRGAGGEGVLAAPALPWFNELEDPVGPDGSELSAFERDQWEKVAVLAGSVQSNQWTKDYPAGPLDEPEDAAIRWDEEPIEW